MTELEAPEIPDYCDLEDQDVDRRREQVEEMLSRAEGIEALDDGYRLSFPGDQQTLALVMEFTLDERRCCPMGDFTLSFQGPGEPATLAFRGPDPMKEDMREGMQLERWFDEVPE